MATAKPLVIVIALQLAPTLTLSLLMPFKGPDLEKGSKLAPKGASNGIWKLSLLLLLEEKVEIKLKLKPFNLGSWPEIELQFVVVKVSPPSRGQLGELVVWTDSQSSHLAQTGKFQHIILTLYWLFNRTCAREC